MRRGEITVMWMDVCVWRAGWMRRRSLRNLAAGRGRAVLAAPCRGHAVAHVGAVVAPALGDAEAAAAVERGGSATLVAESIDDDASSG